MNPGDEGGRMGAPTAVMTLEELIASGITKFLSLGSAGTLQESLNMGGYAHTPQIY
jgi:uridine phosphorylase